MDSESWVPAFFKSQEAKGLNDAQLLRSVAENTALDSSAFYDLTFHAAFAKRIFDVMKREGPNTLGFDRMQQSFSESVEKIRAILLRFESEYHFATSDLTSPTPEARARLSRFIEDLALLKNWLVRQNAR